MTYTPQKPEEDTNLQNNPHYWLYKVTREALDNKDHPLHDMGHIWNRWACEGLSDAEREELGVNFHQYLDLDGSFISENEGRITNHIRNIEGYKEWNFPYVT